MPTFAVLRFVLALAALFWFGAGEALAASATFDGTKTNVNGCTLSGKVYSCTSFPLTSNSNDVLTIASGYTVDIAGSAVFTYNQGLVMSGTAALTVLGTLDVAAMNPANLKVSGGALTANGIPAKGNTPAVPGAFYAGNSSQSLTTNIKADTATFGTGAVTITGNITTTGAINLSSYSTVNGSVSGGTISGGTMAYPATNITINGPITATTSLMLPNRSTVNGAITAPTVTLLASETIVNGAITATTSLYVGNAVTVNGDVTTGTLSTQASDALINGNATVSSATLEHHARVTKTIYCAAGTTTGKCDCVTNNSGWDVNSAYGPTCASKPAAAPAGPTHFLITHNGGGSACGQYTVTVAACANAACSAYFKGGVSATLAPFGSAVKIDTTGTPAQIAVQPPGIGSAALAITGAAPAASNATVCSNTGTSPAGTGCTMNFNGSPSLTLEYPDQQAGSTTPGKLKASILVTANTPSSACAPLFTSAQSAQSVQASCSYNNPTTGTQAVTVGGKSGSNANLACGGAAQAIDVTFANEATASVANVSMQYPDVGALGMTMSVTYNGTKLTSPVDQVIVAPASFGVTAPATLPVVAGRNYPVIVKALNQQGNVTPNFGKESPAEMVTMGYNALYPCNATSSADAVNEQTNLPSATFYLAGGSGTLSVAYPEAGLFKYGAKPSKGTYMGGTAATTPSFSNTGCALTPAIPAYFKVEAGAVRTAPAYYYAGQPIDLTVTAMNEANAVTKNYESMRGTSKAVQLGIIDTVAPARGAPIAAGPATNPGRIPATAFSQGMATVATTASYAGAVTSASALAYKFTNIATGPATVKLRAAEDVTTNTVSSSSGPATAEGQTVIRSGRIRIGGAFGTAKGDLKLPVTAEYYDGKAWRRNVDETFNIPPAAIGTGIVSTLDKAPANVSACTGIVPVPPAGTVCLVQGTGTLTLRPQPDDKGIYGTGTAVAAINLGAALDACVATAKPMAAPAGSAALPWLRSLNGNCKDGSGAPRSGDPAARATFGVFSPEAKRLIHVREVFN